MKGARAFFFLVMISLLAFPAAAQIHYVSGTVFLDDTGKRMDDADVTVRCDGNSVEEKTDEYGCYVAHYSPSECPSGSFVTAEARDGRHFGTASGYMKDFIILNVAAVDVFVTKYSSDIRVSGIFAYEPAFRNDLYPVRISFRNDAPFSIEDVRVSVSIPELGIATSGTVGSMDGGDRHSKRLYLHIPEFVEPGWYDMRISISDGSDYRVRYRPVEVV